MCYVNGTGLPEVTVTPFGRQVVKVTENITLTASVRGVGMENFTYQWRHNGTNITEENILMITNVTESDSGNYQCIVTNDYEDMGTSNVVELIAISKFFLVY